MCTTMANASITVASVHRRGYFPAPLKMPIPEAPWVVIKVTHPCAVSLLRSKLSRTLATPLGNLRYDVRLFVKGFCFCFVHARPLRVGCHIRA